MKKQNEKMKAASLDLLGKIKDVSEKHDLRPREIVDMLITINQSLLKSFELKVKNEKTK